MACANKYLQMKDVYDCASDIFQEFEKIVTITGSDTASTLINKVKNVLESLEESVQKIEFLNKKYAELKSKCLHLTNDKLLKEDETNHLKQAFEELEESWNKESLHLKSVINKLVSENKILHDKLAEKKDVPSEIENTFKTVIEDQENLISKLKSNIKQKDKLSEKDQATIDSLNVEIQRLNEVNKNLHLQYQKAQDTIVELKLEKKESDELLSYQAEKLNNMDQKFEDLKKTIAETCEFSLQSMLDIYKPLQEDKIMSESRLRSLYQEQKKLKQEVEDLKLELTLLRIQMDEYEKEISEAANNQNMENLETHGQLNQVFQLFLEVFFLNPQLGILRNKQMYSS